MFVNEPLRDFTKETERSWIPKVISNLRKQFPISVPAIVGGDPFQNGNFLNVTNPSKTSEVLSKVLDSTTEIAEQAVKACEKAKTTWMKTDVATRVAILRKAAKIMRDRKNELTGMLVLEVAKNFREADGDVAEAIDFCEYYAQQMERLSGLNPTVSTPGEANKFLYEPRGLTLAISPWNFPFAILAGMTVGPLVAGNPVIMKPAEQSSAIALELYNILREAGVPSEALQLVPGRGEVVGAYLVSHPKVHAINFTGSRDVGLMIMAEAAKLAPGQKHLKKVVAELGGKNAVIVDDDADLDEAVVGVLHSAFGFQGQKCSACSRVIILEPAFEAFKARLTEALQSLRMGPADDVTAKVNPVIDAEAQKRLMGVIERNSSKIVGQLAISETLKGTGHFVPPTVFVETDFQSELGQNEMFGPLVALFKVKTFEEAIQAMNGVDYALTGGIFSRNPTHIEMAKKELEVGNLYINRGITGALVCRQPFGGFKLSGCGAKAGGPDYLLQFLEPRTITENTMRRGFAPEI